MTLPGFARRTRIDLDPGSRFATFAKQGEMVDRDPYLSADSHLSSRTLDTFPATGKWFIPAPAGGLAGRAFAYLLD
jgi:hypothetical protein